MQLNDNDILQIVSTICQSVLEASEATPVALPTETPKTIAACVQITGGWQGAIVLACPETFAVKAAAKMFDLAPDACSITDAQDAIAELTNMIGGNLKGLLPLDEPCQLSLPAVVAGGDYNARVPGSRPINRLALLVGDAVLFVNVLEKSTAARAA